MITDDQITELRAKAQQAGNSALMLLCSRALHPHEPAASRDDARRRIEGIIADAEAAIREPECPACRPGAANVRHTCGLAHLQAMLPLGGDL